MSCPYASSVVGTWEFFLDHACLGVSDPAQSITFNSDGSWSSSPNGESGYWIQVEGMVLWNTWVDANTVSDMCFGASVTNNALNGIFGQARAWDLHGPNPDSRGSFYAVRVRQ